MEHTLQKFTNMKNLLISVAIVALIMIGSTVAYSQGSGPGPAPPSGSPESGGHLGGNAPLGSGLAFLLTFGAAYAGKKVSYIIRQQKNSEE
jgi:hypothetical protein